jgi:hypothetical protein
MEVGLFILGILIGVGLTWYLQERYRKDDAQEREANFQSRLAVMQNEVRESDAALAETKERLIALQMEQRVHEARTKPLEAELAEARRVAERAQTELAEQRESLAALRDELARRDQPAGAEAPPAAPEAPRRPRRPSSRQDRNRPPTSP